MQMVGRADCLGSRNEPKSDTDLVVTSIAVPAPVTSPRWQCSLDRYSEDICKYSR